jgi:hypothetical protein
MRLWLDLAFVPNIGDDGSDPRVSRFCRGYSQTAFVTVDFIFNFPISQTT